MVALSEEKKLANQQLSAALCSLRPTELRPLVFHANLLKFYHFVSSQEGPVSHKSSFTTSTHPIWVRPAFRLVLSEEKKQGKNYPEAQSFRN